MGNWIKTQLRPRPDKIASGHGPAIAIPKPGPGFCQPYLIRSSFNHKAWILSWAIYSKSWPKNFSVTLFTWAKGAKLSCWAFIVINVNIIYDGFPTPNNFHKIRRPWEKLKVIYFHKFVFFILSIINIIASH